MSITFQINGRPASVEVEGETPLLWVIRDVVGLKGTKFEAG
jgi:isoquinoline 1-oxidoreductase alpha subunit